jgi:photosystem II stability/assembly factor-like uncharacterized protein
MSIHRGLLLTAVTLLSTAILVACGTPQDAVDIALTPGPAPSARPGANVWVCGSPDLVVGSADGGAAWQVRPRSTSVDPIGALLTAIAFGDRSHGWAVRRGIGNSRARVLATVDGGGSWTWQYPGVKAGRLFALAATDADHVWAAGRQDIKGFGVWGKGLMVATSDGGKTWTRQRLPAGLLPLAVAFADARHGWAVADEVDADAYPSRRSCVLSTSDGGAHWRISYSAASDVTLSGLAAVGPHHCWVVGYAGQQHSGLVVRTTDGGLHWSAQDPVPHQNLKAVSFPDARNGWAVGSGGTVLVTHDGGATWSPQHSGVGLGLGQVSFSDPLHGWALISGRALLGTIDGGKSWSVVRPAGTWNLLWGLTSFDSPAAGQ